MQKTISRFGFRAIFTLETWESVGNWGVNLFALGLLGMYLFPLTHCS